MRARNGKFSYWLLCILLMLGLASSLQAATIITTPSTVTFDFNQLSTNASNGTVQNYIQTQLPGTIVTGAGGGQNYDGEGYVVGPVVNGRVQPYTLGTTDAGLWHGLSGDNFIVNQGSDRITMTFGQLIYSAAFDFEIFPNGSVPDGRNRPASSYPDFTLNAYNGDQLVTSWRVFGDLPGTNGLPANSPNSLRAGHAEYAPQLLSSNAFAFANGVTRLEFVDWPERIGIDNLTLGIQGAQPQSDPPQVLHTPEPTSFVLMAGALGSLLMFSWWRRRQRLDVGPAGL